MLDRYASEGQQRRWSAQLVEGTVYATIGMAEPDDGPDEVHRMLAARELLDDLERHVPWS